MSKEKESRLLPKKMGPKLKRIREELGLSQGAMLNRLGFGEEDGLFRSSISGYELGTRLPPHNVVLAYAKLANIYTDVLIDDDLNLSPENIPCKVKSTGIKMSVKGMSDR